MDCNPQTLQFLSQSFLDTLSPQPELRRRAKESISDAADTPNYGLAVLRLVAEPSVDEQTRQIASVNFKNHIKTRWVPSSATPIPDFEKEQIKTLILPLILSATLKIRAELSEALAVIGNHGFTECWPDLKSSLETAMNANDFASVNGILATLNSLFKSVHHDLFAGDEILQQIIIPNMMLRDEDEELFVKNYLEFINRDMKGSTRRRIACELLKVQNKEKISLYIHHCLAVFAENPVANWKYKECAIYLVVSLATNDLVDVESFFRSFIIPELQDKDVNAFPMLKAAALNFLTVFRYLIPKHEATPLLGDLVRFVGSDFNVVNSYAAICIEKLLLVKDNNKPRYTSTDIHLIHENLIYKLLGALHKAPFSEENHYIMRCIMRVVQIADISPWMPSSCITGLTDAINVVLSHDPKKTPVYNYYLFEAFVILVRRGFEMDPGCVTGLQADILPITRMILDGDVTELFPYAFQLLAQLVDLNRPPVPFPRVYMQRFDNIFSKYYLNLWEFAANVPALALLLESFLQHAPDEVNKEGRLRHVVVEIINKLVSSPNTEEEGFRILNIVIETYEYGVIAEYMNQIWDSVYTRLQNSKTPTLVRCVMVFMSLFLVKHGVQTLVDLINSISIEVDLFNVILGEFWIPNLKTISTWYNYMEVKLCAVASIKLLCESVLLLDPEAEELWGELLDAIVTLLTQKVKEERERVDDDEEPDLTGFLLRNAVVKKEEGWDPFKEIKDPKQFLVTFPGNLSSEFCGKFPLAIMRHLSPTNQTALIKLCNSYNIARV